MRKQIIRYAKLFILLAGAMTGYVIVTEIVLPLHRLNTDHSRRIKVHPVDADLKLRLGRATDLTIFVSNAKLRLSRRQDPEKFEKVIDQLLLYSRGGSDEFPPDNVNCKFEVYEAENRVVEGRWNCAHIEMNGKVHFTKYLGTDVPVQFLESTALWPDTREIARRFTIWLLDSLRWRVL
jgi:hypothetical protein